MDDLNVNRRHINAGTVAELIAIEACVRRGYVVSLPVGGKASYDFVVDTGRKVLRVQVKQIYQTRKKANLTWMVKFEKPHGNGAHKKYRRYTVVDCDYLVAVSPPHGACYVVPIQEVASKRSATFFFDKPPSRFARGNYLWIEAYKEAWF